ncbi:MAG: PD-(D/E)XK nuclease family protein [Pseudonocardiales bacterium]|nr:PD-(D/E)XK nuclease family protein [Pseudonocardiales bacterium]
MSSWRVPEGVVGKPTGIKVSVAVLGPGDYHCPMADALKARQGLQPMIRRPWKPEILEQFTLGPFMSVMDLIEHKGKSLHEALSTVGTGGGGTRECQVHEGLRCWTAHSVAEYLRVFSQGSPGMNGERLLPVKQQWSYRQELTIPDHRGVHRYEIRAWGRCYQSADGRTRELRMLTNRSDARERTDAEIAVAALVVAEGEPGPRPEHVRIVQFACADGGVRPLFEGTRSAAIQRYIEQGKEALSVAVDGREYRPGATCASCAYSITCPALPRAPGLLGISDQTRPRRTWSVTNGRSYGKCPAREHLRRHHLPTDRTIEHGRAPERGRAVHAHLRRRHASSPLVQCVPDVGHIWITDGHDLAEEDIHIGRQLLHHHAEVCPLQHLPPDAEVRVEPLLTFDDTDADVVVLAEPDLLYRDGDSWVWREVKTSGSDFRWSSDLLTEFPQLALAVMMLSRGDLGGSRTRSRVELEVLRPTGVDLEIIDPFATASRAHAAEVLRDLVRDWHADDHFRPRPGAECARCEVARWCPTKSTTEVTE